MVIWRSGVCSWVRIGWSVRSCVVWLCCRLRFCGCWCVWDCGGFGLVVLFVNNVLGLYLWCFGSNSWVCVGWCWLFCRFLVVRVSDCCWYVLICGCVWWFVVVWLCCDWDCLVGLLVVYLWFWWGGCFWVFVVWLDCGRFLVWFWCLFVWLWVGCEGVWLVFWLFWLFVGGVRWCGVVWFWNGW